jgi:hypothetical protein
MRKDFFYQPGNSLKENNRKCNNSCQHECNYQHALRSFIVNEGNDFFHTQDFDSLKKIVFGVYESKNALCFLKED